MRGRIVLAFLFSRLESWGPCGIRYFLGLSLLSGIGFDLSPQVIIFLSQCFHLISTTLLHVSQLLLHLGLTV